MLFRILRTEDARDEEIAEACLKIMLDVVSDSDGDGRSAGPSQGVRNSEAVLSDAKNIELLLDLLQGVLMWLGLACGLFDGVAVPHHLQPASCGLDC